MEVRETQGKHNSQKAKRMVSSVEKRYQQYYHLSTTTFWFSCRVNFGRSWKGGFASKHSSNCILILDKRSGGWARNTGILASHLFGHYWVSSTAEPVDHLQRRERFWKMPSGKQRKPRSLSLKNIPPSKWWGSFRRTVSHNNKGKRKSSTVIAINQALLCYHYYLYSIEGIPLLMTHIHSTS